ncbi:MAG: hypothetical protein JSS49_24950 [Planctomycetes bacterium]|nr:hypothetical protein [Planctomycetota bacterium]
MFDQANSVIRIVISKLPNRLSPLFESLLASRNEEFRTDFPSIPLGASPHWQWISDSSDFPETEFRFLPG